MWIGLTGQTQESLLSQALWQIESLLWGISSRFPLLGQPFSKLFIIFGCTGSCRCVRAFSSCSERLLFVLIAVASLYRSSGF